MQVKKLVLTSPGLYVRVEVDETPEGPVEALVAYVDHERFAERVLIGPSDQKTDLDTAKRYAKALRRQVQVDNMRAALATVTEKNE